LRHIISTVLVAAALLSTPLLAQETNKVSKAQAIAQSWLALTDAGDYSDSWDQAADILKSSITKTQWEAAIQSARSPLGSVKARTLKSAVFTHTLPGVPDGEYIVIQYESQFEHKASAIETIIPLLGSDGVWKVSGYFIN
jgi:Protein of unknown function (DUF4019)